MLRVPVQAVVVVEVARTVSDTVEAGPRLGRIEIAGPEIVDARELARTWRAITGKRVFPLPVLLPGKLGRALSAGAATVDHPDILGTTNFETCLK